MGTSSPFDDATAVRDRLLSELDVAVDTGIVGSAPEIPVPLPSRLATGELAWASVATLAAVAGIASPLDPVRIAMSYRSDVLLTIDGAKPPVWSPYSGFWRTSDGWVRTHGNYPHHARALVHGLGIADDPDRLGEAFAARTSADAVASITSAGGLAVVVSPEDRQRDAILRRTPLLDVRHVDGSTTTNAPRPGGGSGDPPLAGVRVLDLTRVIAGPVCTRTLALLGADVLRVDPPHLPEPEWQHLDTGHGKRSTILDAHSPTFDDLLARADVVVLGYRPHALHRLGLTPDDIARRHPGVVIAQLSAWGPDQPGRAGFDSLVQAESGIALVESPDGVRPGALPAQALDHSAGYLLAAAVIALLDRRRRDGGSWVVRTSLRRVAAELLGMTRTARPLPAAEVDPAPHTAVFEVAGRRLTTARPALPGFEFAPPRPWGRDQPRWP